jgi:hypothetical protein
MSVQTYPQPREGVVGIERTDDLLSLEDSAIPVREMLRGLAFHLHTATLVGDPAPVVQRMYQRITHPQPGDVVVVQDSRYMGEDSCIKGFGILLAERREWWTTDEEWEREKSEDYGATDGERMTDYAWYVQYGPNAQDVCRWVNCSLLAVPIPGERFPEPVGTRDGSGVLLTRDDLLGGLADSGFRLRG